MSYFLFSVFLLTDAIIAPEQGLALLHIPRIESQWYLSFDLKPVNISKDLSNILHLTKGGNEGQAGDRVPGVYFVAGTTTLRICDHTDFTTANCFDSPQQLALNDYINIRIRQTWDVSSSLYKLVVAFDGAEIINTPVIAVQEFENMFLYASDPWSAPAKADIKNLVFKNLPYGKCFCSYTVLLNKVMEFGINQSLLRILETFPRHTSMYLSVLGLTSNVNFPIGYTYSKCNIARSEEGIDCSQYAATSGFRSIEGICNNLKQPTWGSSHIELRRVVGKFKFLSSSSFCFLYSRENVAYVLCSPVHLLLFFRSDVSFIHGSIRMSF